MHQEEDNNINLTPNAKTPKRVCSNCVATSSPVWRKGPLGPKTLCNACGIKFATGKMNLDSQGRGGNLPQKPYIGPSISQSATLDDNLLIEDTEKIIEGKKLEYKGKRKVCSNCSASQTPTWRRGPLGKGSLCNACGLQWLNGTLFLDPLTGAKPGVKGQVDLIVLENKRAVKNMEDIKSTGSSDNATTTTAPDVISSSEAKTAFEASNSQSADEASDVYNSDKQERVPTTPKKRGRGRPRKYPMQSRNLSAKSSDEDRATSPSSGRRGRGRPRGSKSKNHKRLHSDTNHQNTSTEEEIDHDSSMLDEETSSNNETEGVVRRSRISNRKINIPSRFLEHDPPTPDAKNDLNGIHSNISLQKNGSKNHKRRIQHKRRIKEQQKSQEQKQKDEPKDNSLEKKRKKLRSIKRKNIENLNDGESNNSELIMTTYNQQLLHIMTFLDIHSICKCMRVCNAWKETAKSPIIWRELYDRKWKINYHNLCKYSGTIDWRKLYKARSKIRAYSDIEQAEFMCKFYIVENNPKILEVIIDKMEGELKLWESGQKQLEMKKILAAIEHPKEQEPLPSKSNSKQINGSSSNKIAKLLQSVGQSIQRCNDALVEED